MEFLKPEDIKKVDIRSEYQNDIVKYFSRAFSISIRRNRDLLEFQERVRDFIIQNPLALPYGFPDNINSYDNSYYNPSEISTVYLLTRRNSIISILREFLDRLTLSKLKISIIEENHLKNGIYHFFSHFFLLKGKK